jgi:hypothetical protein
MLHAMEAGRGAQRCKNEAWKSDYEETKYPFLTSIHLLFAVTVG